MPKLRVRLIHWNAEEAKGRAKMLRAAGYTVVARPFGPDSMKALNRKPPDVMVIDLTRLPMQGRDVAVMVRHRAATRRVPIVFAEGEPAKRARIEKDVPGAVFTTWGRIRSALKRALANPPVDPTVPASNLAGYSGTPLPKKLGIKPDSTLTLLGSPPGFEKTLGRVPDGVALKRQARGATDLVLWFVRSQKQLDREFAKVFPLTKTAGLWIVWPKKASDVTSDLSEKEVREFGLARGLVDFKVCAVDQTWSGLKFVRRNKQGVGGRT